MPWSGKGGGLKLPGKRFRTFPHEAVSQGQSRNYIDGSQATAALSRQPPDTTGYTTRTFTEAESVGYTATRDVAAQSIFILTLDDATDYVIQSPYVIRRPVRIVGGRNIVWKAAHVKLEHLGIDFFPAGTYVTPLALSNGASNQAGRIIHLEGHWWEGVDMGRGLMLGDLTDTHIRMMNFNVASFGPRSSEAFAANVGGFPPNSSDGVRMYQGVEHTHADLIKTNGDYASLYVERVTAETGLIGIHLDHGATSTNTIRKVNIKAAMRTTGEEGPLGTETQTWSTLLARATFEATQDGFTAAVAGATLTYPYTTAPAPLSGTQSLRVSRADPTIQIVGVSRTFGSPTDWSNNGNSNALSCLVHLEASSTDYPMMRIDATENAAALTSGEDDWYLGQAHPVTVGVTRRLICPFPYQVLSALRKVRVVLTTDDSGAGSGTHTFILDDVSSGNGATINSFTGPTLTWEGKWALYHGDANFSDNTAGVVYVSDLWGKVRPKNLWKNGGTGDGSGTNYTNRYYDPDAGGVGVGGYVLDLPPGDATHVDFWYPSPPTTGSDGTGTYDTWSATAGPKLRDATTPTTLGSAKVYDGDPPGGDFCPDGIAGIGYLSPLYEMLLEPSSAQSAATLALTAPLGPVPLQTSAAQSSATLVLTAPTKVALGTSAAQSSATLALTAPTQVPLGTSAAVSSATLALRAPALVTLSAAAQSSATLALTAPTQIPLGTSAAVSTGTLALKAATTIPLGTSAATSSATLALTAKTQVILGTSAAQSSATLTVYIPSSTVPLATAAAQSSATLTLTAKTTVPLGTAAAQSSATLTVQTPQPAVIALNPSAAVVAGVMGLTAKTTIVLFPSAGVSTATLASVFLDPAPETHQNLGGNVVTFSRSGNYDQTITGGNVVATIHTGTVVTFSRSGNVDEPRRSGHHDEALTGGNIE